MTFTVLATDRVSREGLATLREDDRFALKSIDDSASPEFDQALKQADALVVRSTTTVNAAMIEAGPSLKVIGRAGVGIDNIDLEAATAKGIAVFNAPGGNTVAAVELTMALMLAVARLVTHADSSVRAGEWDRARFRGIEMSGRTLGLIGAGRIGGEVARRCQAFGMDVVVYDPYLTEDTAASLGVRLVELDHVIKVADVISIHVPLTDETRGLVDAGILHRVKDGVLVINASRGGVIDEAALANALHRGTIAGAGLDVYENEPLPSDSPLRDAPNLVLTPHIGAATAEAQVRVAAEVAHGIRSGLIEGDYSLAINAGEIG